MVLGDIVRYVSTNLPTILVGTVVLLITAYILKSRKFRKLPPGPSTYPIIGNFNYIGKYEFELHLLFHRLKEKYGDIASLFFGRNLFIILNSYDVIREAVIEQADIFNDRGILHKNKEMEEKFRVKAHSIISSSGEEWRKLRKMTIGAFRDFGVGKKALEETCVVETTYLIDSIAESKGEPIDVRDLIANSVSNIICSIVFGDRFEYDDEEFQMLLETLDSFFKIGGFKRPNAHLPFLSKFLYPQMKNPLGKYFELVDFVSKRVKEHRETFDQNNVRDFTDLFLKAQIEEGGDLFSEASLILTITDLFAAGTETTNTTLRWLLIYFLYNPEVQDKCFAELEKVIGFDRTPTYRDRENCPYIMATIHELQRCANIAPFAVPHSNNKDTTLRGYNIPKGSTIILNTYSVHMDPKYWPEPEKFRPDRWLDENGEFFKHERFIPFSTGRRFCMGEQLAKMELFLFVTTLVKSFRFEPEDPNKLPELKGISGITLSPPVFKIRAIKRE